MHIAKPTCSSLACDHTVQNLVSHFAPPTWLVVRGTSILSLAKAPRMSREWFRRWSTGFAAADLSAFFAFLPYRRRNRYISD